MLLKTKPSNLSRYFSSKLDQCLNNINAEIPNWNFEKVKQDADQRWNKTLNRFNLKPTKIRTIFYTALYHTYFAPTIFNDANGDYLGTDKQVYEKQDFCQPYGIFALGHLPWASPLMILEDRKINQDFIKTMLAIYQQQGVNCQCGTK
jgi:putative alpha-1,2-mannosidase